MDRKENWNNCKLENTSKFEIDWEKYEGNGMKYGYEWEEWFKISED